MTDRIVYTSFLLGMSFASTEAQVNTPPNIVLISCDDMGFSDLGCYGSKIQTPNIDRLAEDGVCSSLFENTGRSCPSRAALPTGHYQYEADMGWMTAVDEHHPGYRGRITKNIPTIVEVIKADGHNTYMSGKWHVTVDGASDASNDSYPAQWGSDKYYGCLNGGGSHYKPIPVYSNLARITEFPDDYYYTTAITDPAISFVKQHPIDKPMFTYVAHYALHLSLQAPADRVEKCRDRYKVGYDVLRKRRFNRSKELKFILDEMDYPVYQKEFGGKRPSQGMLTPEQQEQWTTDMATYTAMIETVDSGIDELVEAIKEKEILDNTVFIFLSDNGTTREGGYLGQLMADLGNTPYRGYKSQCFQGGTSIPFILSYSDVGKNKMKGQICGQSAYIIDILPICMDIATATCPSEFKENLPGKSLLSSIHGKKIKPRELYFEHQSSCAIISGHWKLVRDSWNEPWGLIDLSTGLFETKDLFAQYPKIVKKLEVKWNKWMEQCNVFPFENKPWTERINYYLKRNPDQSGKE